MKYKKALLYIHWISLLVTAINIILLISSNYSLKSSLAYIARLLIILSGISLFFYYRKPFKKRAFYFGIYLFSPLLALIAALFDGIFGVIVIFTMLSALIPPNKVSTQDSIIIYEKIQSPLGGFPKYEIVRDYHIVEKHLCDFSDEMDENTKVRLKDDSLHIQYSYKDHDLNKTIETDTIIKVD